MFRRVWFEDCSTYQSVSLRLSHRSTPLVIGALLAVALLALPHLATAQETKGTRVTVPDTRVSLIPPPGFQPADRFAGFQRAATTSSIVVAELPEAASTLQPQFTDEALATRGVKVVRRTPVDVGKTKGELLFARQKAAGVAFQKWILLFGDGTATVLVTGVCPTTLDVADKNAIKKAMLTARLEKKAATADSPTFTITPAPPFKHSVTWQKFQLFTIGGRRTKGDVAQPVLLAGASVRPYTGSLAVFAKMYARNSDQENDVVIRSHKAVRIGRLEGREIVADAVDKEDKNLELVVYQLLIKDPHRSGFYFVVKGRVKRAEGKKYLPLFKKMGRSFRLSNP